jgi:uncharacterized protein YtpQ (UPF0354 family)
VWNQDFENREIPPMSAEMFSALVTSRLRPLPDIEFLGGTGLSLQLRVRGQETTAQLERYYERYRVQRDALTPIIDEFIAALQSDARVEMRGTNAYEQVASSLFPRFMTAQQWSEKRDHGLRPVIRPLVQDLGIALVVDREREIEYVQIESIPAWGIDADEAYSTALKNLERTAQIETAISGEGIETLLIDHNADGYAAARALLPTRWRDWQARIQGELILALPTQDVLLGFSREHPALEDLRAQVLEDAQTRANGLFPHLLIARNNELELYSG